MDDFKEWRVRVREMLQRPEWQVTEACDGLEAVHNGHPNIERDNYRGGVVSLSALLANHHRLQRFATLVAKSCVLGFTTGKSMANGVHRFSTQRFRAIHRQYLLA